MATAGGVGALTGVLAIRAADEGEAISADTATVLLSMACVSALALARLRLWITGYERRTKANLEDLSRRHTVREDQLEKREADLRAREAAHIRREERTILRTATLNERVEHLLRREAEHKAALEEMTENYRAICAEHDELVKRELRDGAQRFTTRADGYSRLGPAADGTRAQSAHARSAPAEVAVFRPREQHETV